MKKYISLVMLLIGITWAQAQRMLPKQKGLEINAGGFSSNKSGRNYYLDIGMTVNGKKGGCQLWALEYSHEYSRYQNLFIPLETYTAEVGYNFFLLGDAGKNIALTAGLTGIGGYESINRGKEMLYDGTKILSEDNLIYGAGGRLSLEVYVSDHIVLLLQGRIKALWGTDLEHFRPSAGMGVRFNF